MIGKIPKILRLISNKFVPLPLTESWISTSLSPATQLEKSLPHKSNRPILITTKYFHFHQLLNHFETLHEIESDFLSKSLCHTFTISGTLVVSHVQMWLKFTQDSMFAISPQKFIVLWAAHFPKSACPFHLGVIWLIQSHPLNLPEIRFWTSCMWGPR